MLDIVAATVPETQDRGRVGNVQQRDAGRHHTVERSRGSQIQQAKNTDNEAADAVRDEGHVEGEVDPRDPLVAGYPAVTRERPHQTRLPGVAGNQTSHSRDQEQSLQDDGAGLVVQRLVVKLQNRDLCGRVDELVQVLQTKEHGKAVEPRGGETNRNRGQDGNRDVSLWLRHLFSHVSGRVQTSEDPVGVDQTDNKRHAVRLPPRRVDEMRKDILCALMGRSAGRDRDQNNEKGKQRDVQSPLGHQWQRLAKAVEQVAEEVDDLVSHHYMPRLDGTITCQPRETERGYMA